MRRAIALMLAVLLGAALALAGALPANAQTGNFQDNNSLTGTFSTTSTTREIVGQTFTAQATGKLKSITVWVGGTSNSQTMNLIVDNVTGGFPNGSGEHYFGIILNSASTSEQVFYLQNSDGGLDVVAGQTYAFYWYAYGGTKLVSTTSGDAYSGGSMFQGIDNSFPQGYQSAFSGQDFRFVTSIDSTTVTNPTVTGTPSAGTVGATYSFGYTLGGTPVASKVRISSGSLPPGLGISNSGVISGTPTSAGTYSFTAEVDNGAYATISSSIVVQSQEPGAPTGAGAVAGYKQATVSFTPPAYIGTSPILDHTVTSSPGGLTCTATAPQTSCIVTGLTAGGLYRFTVTARNSSGSGPASAQTGFVQPYAEPGSPSPVWATGGDEQLTVNWGPVQLFGAPVTGFTVTLSPGAGTCTVPSGTYSCIIFGLTNGVSYTPTVVALSNVGSGPPNSGPAAAPGRLASVPTSFNATPGDRSVSLTWNAPTDEGGFPHTSYTVRYRDEITDPWVDVNLGAEYLTVTGLTAAEGYEFQVAAVTPWGTGSYATVFSIPYGPPAAPTLWSVVPGNSELTVSWLPTFDYGAPITSFWVQYKASSSSVWLNGPSTASLSASVPGLTNGISYDVQVRANNIAGPGPWSLPMSATPATTATAPQSFTATAGDESITVDWATPADLGGYPVLYYLVSYGTGGAWTSVSTTLLSETFIGLDNATSYDLRVYAVTAAGDGAIATTSATPFGVPGSVVVTPTAGDSQVSLSWTAAAPNGSPVTSYELQYKLASASVWTTAPAPAGLSATVTGLTNGPSYDFRVRAHNLAGDGAFAVASAIPVGPPRRAAGVHRHPGRPVDSARLGCASV